MKKLSPAHINAQKLVVQETMKLVKHVAQRRKCKDIMFLIINIPEQRQWITQQLCAMIATKKFTVARLNC